MQTAAHSSTGVPAHFPKVACAGSMPLVLRMLLQAVRTAARSSTGMPAHFPKGMCWVQCTWCCACCYNLLSSAHCCMQQRWDASTHLQESYGQVPASPAAAAFGRRLGRCCAVATTLTVIVARFVLTCLVLSCLQAHPGSTHTVGQQLAHTCDKLV